MLANILNENDLDVKKCIGIATDGAANIQGEFNDFSGFKNCLLIKSTFGVIPTY